MKVDLKQGKALIAFEPNAIAVGAIVDALKEEGYEAAPL